MQGYPIIATSAGFHKGVKHCYKAHIEWVTLIVILLVVGLTRFKAISQCVAQICANRLYETATSIHRLTFLMLIDTLYHDRHSPVILFPHLAFRPICHEQLSFRDQT